MVELVGDFSVNDFNLLLKDSKGKLSVIDFYAEWCQPCKMIAPVLEELQSEFGEKIEIFKVNTEDQQELAAVFGVQSIPSLLFIPLEGEPQMAQGALPKDTFIKAIDDVLKVTL